MTEIDKLVTSARQAMEEIKDYDQEQTDRMVKVIGKVIYDHAEELAVEAVEETKFGNVEAKTTKNTYFPTAMWNYLRGKKSVGVIERDEAAGIIKVAHPGGVVGSITPITVPNILPMGNSMFALKGRNAIIISPHPGSVQSVGHTVELMRKELEKIGAPKNLIQMVPHPSKEASAEVMRKVDIIIATGGPGLTKAAFSSGKPAFAGGAGNAQVILEDTDDLAQFAEDTITSRVYDNGTACVCAQTLLYPREDREVIKQSLTDAGSYWIEDPENIEKIRTALFDSEGNFRKEMAGRTVQHLAKEANFEVPEGISVLIVDVDRVGADEVLNDEKIIPVLTAKAYDGFEEALDIAKANLEVKGKGHTSAIYSSNEDHILQAGVELPVSRLMVNQPSSDAGSGPHNSLNPTNTVSCGFWANNSINKNLSYEHLLNIQRIALRVDQEPIPENIWDLD